MIQSPFKFLDAYQKEDREVFFGRETEIKNLYELSFRASLILLYGASGTGKTSLIQCGLASMFKESDWLPVAVRRGNNLNESLQKALEKVSLTPFLDYNDDGTISVLEALDTLYLDYFKPIYLIFDQFEELFILGNQAEQRLFLESIAEVMTENKPYKILLSMREEYIGELYDFEKKIPELLNKRLRVEPMNRPNLTEVVVRTCQKLDIGLENTENLVNLLLDSIGSKKAASVSLPYLQVYLDKLYRKAHKEGEKTVFTEKLVQETGKIQDVLEDFLKERIAETDQKFGEKDLCRKILNEFLSSEGTKRPCEWEQISSKNLVESEKLRAILLHLTHSRILVGEENRYELAHDSLAAAIDRLRTAEEKAIADIRKMLHESLQNYQRNGSLLTAENLNYILKNPYFEKVALENAEKELLAKSKAKLKAEKIRLYAFVSSLAILTVFAVGFGWYAFKQKNQADKATQIAKKAQTEAEYNLKKFEDEQQAKIEIQIKKLVEEAIQAEKSGEFAFACDKWKEILELRATHQVAQQKLKNCN